MNSDPRDAVNQKLHIKKKTEKPNGTMCDNNDGRLKCD